MLFFQDSKIENLSVHHVGNKLREEFYILHDPFFQKLAQDEDLTHCLLKFFCQGFMKINDVYRLFHPNGDLELNEVYYYISQFFKGMLSMHGLSIELTKFLYEISCHPKIKSSDFYVVQFKDIQFEGELFDAIGLFKSYSKNTFLQVNSDAAGIDFKITQNAINMDSIDEGTLILKSEKDLGYKVLFVDGKNTVESQIWKDDFLKVKVRNDNYQQTSNVIKLAKQFIVEKMDDMFELEKADKIDMINKTSQYFKEHEKFDQEEFMEVVFGDNATAIALYSDYKDTFSEEYNVPMDSSFDISEKAVKKIQPSLKSVIKLDKNAHIYLHGKREILEKGFDEEKGMNFYKVFFENES
ncbi:hypothetical protein KO02_16325 [Sphingobacterium sp. ML3W]|uniref:nucleoid-associated protein n=1 Tax=Sphingobacterium sp. ML3W TaxID=1538644 RepID=UPI0004F7E2B3|nr:nucleoid-associated protein [Sphingobacterium sp. ML3W]AIM38076.1 hypothetical protein KO02_16325 [Sphingobacterium sp. ML3W]